MNFKTILFCTILINYSILKAQYVVDFKLHYGYVLPFYDAIEYVVNTGVYSADITLLKKTKGKDFWEVLYKYPLYGIGISFSNLGNDKVYGYATSLYFCFDYTLFKNKYYGISTIFNSGYSYINRKFDVYDNYLNRAIGSHNNIFIRFSVLTNLDFYNDHKLLFDCSFTHYSNGKTKSPNYGLNILTFSAGIRFNINNFSTKKSNKIDLPTIPAFKKFNHYLIVSGGNKVYDNLLNLNYKFFTITYQLAYVKSWLKQYGTGISVFYDESVGEAINKDVGLYDNRMNIRFRVATYVARIFRFKNLMFHIMAGYYVYSKYTDLTPFYTRMFLQYYFINKLSFGIGLKAHMAKADMLEWGFGIKL